MEQKPPLLLFNVPATGTKASHRKAPTVNRIKVDHEVAKPRYYYHRRLDRSIFKLDGAKRIIECDFTCLEDIPTAKKQRFYISELLKLGYNVQYKVAVVPVSEPPVMERLMQEYLQDKGI